jgi:heat shock protein HtpX
MARHRVIPFDDHRHPELKNVIPPTDPKYPAIRRRMWVTFGKTFLGYAAMGALCALALWGFGYGFTPAAIWHIVGWGGLFWFGLPLLMWWFCAEIACAIQHAVPADPNNPDHARIQRCLDEVYAESGLNPAQKPPLYASPDESPNAFATGPIHRKARVAFTAGLLKIGLTDEEIKAVFAHEIGHVRNYDVAINSMLSMLSSLLFLVINAGVQMVLGTIGFLQAILNPKRGGFLGWIFRAVTGILNNLLLFVLFWFISQFTKIIQMFVVRSRESGADATGAYITGNPCALATALEKLVDYVVKHRPKPGTREFVMYQCFRPMMTIDPLFDSNTPEPAPTGVWARIKAFWRYLQLTHPPVPERVAELERMNGGACPRI